MSPDIYHEVIVIKSQMVEFLLVYFSIEFDRDSEFFAIAGVTKKIKVFEYGIVRDAVVDLHYPITEMSCASKIRQVARVWRTELSCTRVRPEKNCFKSCWLILFKCQMLILKLK